MDIYNFQQRVSKAGKNISLFAGINLIILAITIFLFPEILAYAVAALLMIAGISLLGFGLRKRFAKKPNSYENQYQETVYYNI
ncbi:MAG: hypothetical protein ACPGLV_04170 [Bacteroidia bacterium]